ncbi:hypothetical protein [Salininema proteolyticum]|uniref:Lipoprotein n=1 Tax=Salininema proteolyticum TaxID=1607685 RepID=A0ABV8U0U7_9ACTN
MNTTRDRLFKGAFIPAFALVAAFSLTACNDSEPESESSSQDSGSSPEPADPPTPEQTALSLADVDVLALPDEFFDVATCSALDVSAGRKSVDATWNESPNSMSDVNEEGASLKCEWYYEYDGEPTLFVTSLGKGGGEEFFQNILNPYHDGDVEVPGDSVTFEGGEPDEVHTYRNERIETTEGTYPKLGINFVHGQASVQTYWLNGSLPDDEALQIMADVAWNAWAELIQSGDWKSATGV